MNIDIINFCNNMKHANPTNKLIDYYASSENPDFKYDECLNLMSLRTPPDSIQTLNINTHETNIFIKRFKSICSNNTFYRLINIIDPSCSDIENLSYIDPCYAILAPIKKYLIDHPPILKQYKGFLPFGKQIIKYWNSTQNSLIKNSPSYADHIKLQTLTNNNSDISGIPPTTINTLMFLKGKELLSQENQNNELEENISIK
jgi:hypothetical protein